METLIYLNHSVLIMSSSNTISLFSFHKHNNNFQKTCINLTNRLNKISEGHKSESFSFASHIVTYMSEKRDTPFTDCLRVALNQLVTVSNIWATGPLVLK